MSSPRVEAAMEEYRQTHKDQFPLLFKPNPVTIGGHIYGTLEDQRPANGEKGPILTIGF